MRQKFIEQKPQLVAELREKEDKRRERKRKKQDPEEDWIILIAPDHEEE